MLPVMPHPACTADVHVKEVLDNVWEAVFHPSLGIREGAASALHACLALVAGRESRNRAMWYKKVLEEAKRGFGCAMYVEELGLGFCDVEQLGCRA